MLFPLLAALLFGSAPSQAAPVDKSFWQKDVTLQYGTRSKQPVRLLTYRPNGDVSALAQKIKIIVFLHGDVYGLNNLHQLMHTPIHTVTQLKSHTEQINTRFGDSSPELPKNFVDSLKNFTRTQSLEENTTILWILPQRTSAATWFSEDIKSWNRLITTALEAFTKEFPEFALPETIPAELQAFSAGGQAVINLLAQQNLALKSTFFYYYPPVRKESLNTSQGESAGPSIEIVTQSTAAVQLKQITLLDAVFSPSSYTLVDWAVKNEIPIRIFYTDYLFQELKKKKMDPSLCRIEQDFADSEFVSWHYLAHLWNQHPLWIQEIPTPQMLWTPNLHLAKPTSSLWGLTHDDREKSAFTWSAHLSASLAPFFRWEQFEKRAPIAACISPSFR